MSINCTFIELILWRDSSALVFQCILTILPLLFHWICCAPHHGTTLAACPTNSGVSKVYCTVLPKTMDFFDEAVALWTLGLCSVYPHSCTKTGILPCSSCTTEPHQRLLHGEVSFPNSLPGKKILLRFRGLGLAFYIGTTWAIQHGWPIGVTTAPGPPQWLQSVSGGRLFFLPFPCRTDRGANSLYGFAPKSIQLLCDWQW